MDAFLVTIVAAIVAAVAIPLLEMSSRQARRSALLENLHVLRSQIELYRAEHSGHTPVVHNGTLTQLIRATDARGAVGDRGTRYPLGPYLRNGMPVNPYTGRSIVTESPDYPFKKSSGAGGWLYHPPTGQIAADMDEHLGE
jgi:general secretion pathway protein G